METYKEVGQKVGLRDELLDIYVKYMTTRWASTEKQKASDGYAKEWAVRFKDGIAWERSDSVGKELLVELEYERV